MRRLKSQVMARTVRKPTGHTDWCGQGHLCGADEHRGPSQIVDDAIGGRAVITRVQAGNVEYVEVNARVPLHVVERGARWQVAETLRWMRALLGAVALRPGVVDASAEQVAVAGRRAVTRR